MEHVNGAGKANGVNGRIRVAVVVIAHFQNTRPAESLQRLRPAGLSPELRLPKRAADAQSHRFGKSSEVVPARSDPAHRFRFGLVIAHQRRSMLKLAYPRLLCQQVSSTANESGAWSGS